MTGEEPENRDREIEQLTKRLTDGKSLIETASQVMGDNAKLRADLAEAKRVMEPMELWLTAALECNNWHWDSDQKAYATESRDAGRAFLKKGETK